MIRTLFILLGVVALGVRAVAEEPAPPKLWFPVGEKLVYKAYWSFLPVARSEVTTEWIDYEGRRLLAVRFRTRSNKVIATVYPVDDLIECLIDPETFLPVRFIKRLNEGRYHANEMTTFDHANRKAHFLRLNQDGTIRGRKEYPIESDTRDLVSFMYYMRSKSLNPGDERTFRVMADEKLYDLFVKAPRVEKVQLKRYGKVSSLRLAPQAAFQGLFVPKGKMTLWVSRDPRRIITKVMAKVPVASVKLMLYKVEGPGDDFWVGKKKQQQKKQKEHGHDD